MVKVDRYKNYRKLLLDWENQCVLCGEGFDNLDSVTREHLIPRSFVLRILKRKNTTEGNLAPSHFNCNCLRATLSLIETMKILNDRKHRLGIEEFRRWINKKVPNRWPPQEKPKSLTLSKSQKRKLKRRLRKLGYQALTERDIIK